jgi:hypothetical protein
VFSTSIAGEYYVAINGRNGVVPCLPVEGGSLTLKV